MTESSILVPFKETEFDEKNRKSCIDPRLGACSGVKFCANIQKLSKTYFLVCIWIAWIILNFSEVYDGFYKLLACYENPFRK